MSGAKLSTLEADQHVDPDLELGIGVGLHERGDLRVTLAVGRLCGQHADYLPVVDLERRLGSTMWSSMSGRSSARRGARAATAEDIAIDDGSLGVDRMTRPWRGDGEAARH